jgi:hypothetical protein
LIGSTIHHPRVNAVAVEPHRLPRHAAQLGVAGLKAVSAPVPWQVRYKRYIRYSGTKYGCRWLANNFDVAFDQTSRDEYLRYIEARSFSALLEGQEYRVDQHGDMQLDVNFRFGIVSQPLLKYWRH